MTQEKPHVVLVDDNPSTVARTLSSVRSELTSEILEPDEVTAHHLESADLVLVDHFLHEWLDSNSEGPSRRPKHGIALAGALQSYVDGLDDQSGEPIKNTPTAFALVSADLKLVGGRLPDDVREHAIARLHNLEWAFDKGDRHGLPAQVLELACAVRALPAALRGEQAQAGRQALQQLLAVPPDARWADEARSDIFRCHPPIFELAQLSKGLAVVRWLLHRIIPYPTFLLDDFELAARLSIAPTSIDSVVAGGLLLGAQYNGVLSTFNGRRWWRVGVEQAIWDLTDGRRQPLKDVLDRSADSEIEQLDHPNPVVVIDPEYRSSEIVPADRAVRVQPDDWPPFADDAWMTIEQIRDNPHLEALVLDDDHNRVGSDQ